MSRFAMKFKGVAAADIEHHCSTILADVNLTADADNRVSSFSGGMKRRLSVGIASVAEPRIIFLECVLASSVPTLLHTFSVICPYFQFLLYRLLTKPLPAAQ